YGDDIASGKILANQIRFNLKDQLKDFIAKNGLIIGICNGFQILVKAGLLPDVKNEFNTIEASLSLNDSAKFEDRWVYLKTEETNCVWTKNIAPVIYLPVAHAEGKFIPKDNSLLEKLKQNKQIVFRYTLPCTKEPAYPWNPNGAIDNIAGICDTTGRIFGLMPHPERHIQHTQHPFWTRLKKRKEGDGLQIFRNAIEFSLSL
ncbi:MAG: phosphoribosylformylglycinamidine synthase subunit PurQ, partial [Candidatus Omnitrophica bacterium]|nr:phosphoribosylformylglycinamidine synthase subunit PurQ [Candidatus Omnitrophota bacterium]